MGYREDLEIDRFSLDVEWEKQPIRFLEYGEKAVEAQFLRDKAKEKLDLMKAQVDLEIRESKLEGKKITESAISNLILSDERCVKLNNEYLESIRNAKILDVAKEAFDHKKKALEKITDLWISGYWSGPKIKKEGREYSNERSLDHREILQENARLRRRRVTE